MNWTLKLDTLSSSPGEPRRWRLRDTEGELQGSWPSGDFQEVLRRTLNTYCRATGRPAVVRLDERMSRARSWWICPDPEPVAD